MPPPSMPEGWYPDPKDETKQRFWDGRAWTQMTVDKGNVKASGSVPPTASVPEPVAVDRSTTPRPFVPAVTGPAIPPKGGFGCGMGCLVIIGIAVVIGIIAGISAAVSGSHNSDPSNDDDLAIVSCQDLVKQNLKSPSTASFPEVPTMSGDTITGEVDAENSFGAEIRADFQCTRVGDQVRLDSLDNR